MNLISFIGKIPGFKPVLKFVFKNKYNARVKKYSEIRKRNYAENGMEAASQFHKCMIEHGFKYMAAYGTMLGAIREHGFIKHDLDLDFWMWKEDDKPTLITDLEKFGFKLHSYYSIDNDSKGKELTFVYKGCHVDIFFIYPPINILPYSTLFIPRKEGRKVSYSPIRIELPVSRERKTAKFETLDLFIPENAEDLCILRYGPDYMTPNPSWDWKKSTDSVVDWSEMRSKTIVKHY